MQTFLNIVRFTGLVVFIAFAGMALLTLLNYAVGFSDAYWLDIVLIRLHLFLAVIGILGYILVTFRRRKDEPERKG